MSWQHGGFKITVLTETFNMYVQTESPDREPASSKIRGHIIGARASYNEAKFAQKKFTRTDRDDKQIKVRGPFVRSCINVYRANFAR